MTFHSRYLLAAALGLWIAHPLPGQEPARLSVERGSPLALRPDVAANQRMADTIAEHLRLGGQLRHYNIDIAFQNGAAELTGTVADQSQREEAIRLARALVTLPEDQREAVRLRHLEGWSLAEISAHFNRTPAATAGLIKRGMQKLREKLGADSPL